MPLSFGHAEKWAATIDLLKQHGVDPDGYEDFEKGRSAAIAASGVTPFSGSNPEGSESS